MLASVKTAAQNTDLISSLQEFAGTENVSKFWIGINRPNPYTDNWNWNIGGTTCPVDDKYGKQYFKESFKLEMVKNRNWQFQIGNFKLAISNWQFQIGNFKLAISNWQIIGTGLSREQNF